MASFATRSCVVTRRNTTPMAVPRSQRPLPARSSPSTITPTINRNPSNRRMCFKYLMTSIYLNREDREEEESSLLDMFTQSLPFIHSSFHPFIDPAPEWYLWSMYAFSLIIYYDFFLLYSPFYLIYGFHIVL